MRPHLCRDRRRENARHRVADLPCDLDLRPDEAERVRERLEARRLPVRDRTVLVRMQIAALLRLEELRADRDGRPVPPESAEQVRAAGGLADPTLRRDVAPVLLQVESVAAGRD